MTKKITLLLVIFLIWGCGYQPVYLKKNNSEQKIKTITLNGEQKINKIIVDLVPTVDKKYNSQKNQYLTLI